MRLLKNCAQADVIKRDRKPVLFSEALNRLFALWCTDRFWPDPSQLRIVNRANLLVLQLGFDLIGKFTHQGIASFPYWFVHAKSIQFISKV